MPHAITSLNPAKHAGITRMLQEASAKTGTGFDHLVNTAMRESSFNPVAKASTSSASGMFQFIEQTWLGMVKRHGAEHGLGEEASKIFQDSTGRYNVPDASQRRAILALRQDPRISALMAGELTAENRKVLENRLDRDVSSGELYAAHVLGAGGAARLITAAEQTPNSRAASLFPTAAADNRGIFYENGRARNVSEVMAFLAGGADSSEPEMVYAANKPGPSHTAYTSSVYTPGASSLTAMGHNARILSSDMIAIMASLDVPGGDSSSRTAARTTRQYQDILSHRG